MMSLLSNQINSQLLSLGVAKRPVSTSQKCQIDVMRLQKNIQLSFSKGFCVKMKKHHSDLEYLDAYFSQFVTCSPSAVSY